MNTTGQTFKHNLRSWLRAVFASLRVRLLVLILLALIPTLGLMIYNASEQRLRAAAEAQANALRLARVAAVEQERLIKSAHYLLITLAQLPAIRNQDPIACGDFLAQLLAQYPPYSNFGAVDRAGNIFCSGKGVPNPVNLSDRPYFRDAVETRAFAVGEYAITRTNPKPGITFGYPVIGNNGDVQGIVFTGLNLDRLVEFLPTVALPSGTSLWVIDRQGLTLANYPETGQWIGQRLPEPQVLARVLAQQEGVMEAVDAKGSSRLYAFTVLRTGKQADLYVIISIPAAVAFAEGDQNLARNLVGLSLGAVGALIAALLGANVFVLRPVDSLVAATRQLSRGDLSTRALNVRGGGELNQLGSAFNEMAQALDRRAVEQKRAQEEIQRQSNRTHALANIANRLNAQLDLDAVLNAVCDETVSALNVPAVSVCLYDQNREALVIAADFGLPSEFRERFVLISRDLYDRYTQEKGLIRIFPDIQKVAGTAGEKLYSALNIRTLAVASMMREHQLVGSLNIYSRGETRRFSEDDLMLIKGIADQAAQAIANAHLYVELKEEGRARAMLLHKTIKAQEDERNRIARELHDETSQSLSALMLGLNVVRDVLKEDVQKADAHLQDIQTMAEGMLQSIHRVIADLRPALLDDLGLAPAISWYGEQRLDPLGMAFHFQEDELEERLPRPMETALFRIAQEGITNAIRHAHAPMVSVRLVRQNNSLLLEIADNGCGFDPLLLHAGDLDGQGFGLRGMQERAEILGGEFHLETAPGKGTRVTVQIQVPKVEVPDV